MPRPNTLLIDRSETLAVCGRKAVEQHQWALHTLLLRAFDGKPKHSRHPNAVALSYDDLRERFGTHGSAVLRRYFDKVHNHRSHEWTAAYRLNAKTARRVELYKLGDDTLARRPFTPTVRPVGDTGLHLPDSLAVSLDHLNGVLEHVQQARAKHGAEHCPFPDSTYSVQTIYQQLLSVRSTVIETGGLPNTYKLQAHGRWGGAHDHHPLTLNRPTRFLTLGDRADLWDVDLSNAHLVIALGLVRTWHPEVELEVLPMYLQHRNEWLDELRRRFKTERVQVSAKDAKDVARAWLYGARRTNPGSSNLVLRSPACGAVLDKLPVWNILYGELRGALQALVPHSPLATGKAGKRLSHLTSEWETNIMRRLGGRLLDAGVNLQAWMHDGFLLVQEYTNPTRALEAAARGVQDELQGEGFAFEHLAVSVKSMVQRYEEHVTKLLV